MQSMDDQCLNVDGHGLHLLLLQFRLLLLIQWTSIYSENDGEGEGEDGRGKDNQKDEDEDAQKNDDEDNEVLTVQSSASTANYCY